DVDWVGVQTQIERAIQRLLRREMQSNPLLVFLMQIPEEASFGRGETVQAATAKPEAPKLSSSLPSPSLPTPANQVTGRRRPRTAARAS
ncbi:MAG: ribonuclease J, partial [Microcoleus sp.]